MPLSSALLQFFEGLSEFARGFSLVWSVLREIARKFCDFANRVQMIGVVLFSLPGRWYIGAEPIFGNGCESSRRQRKLLCWLQSIEQILEKWSQIGFLLLEEMEKTSNQLKFFGKRS